MLSERELPLNLVGFLFYIQCQIQFPRQCSLPGSSVLNLEKLQESYNSFFCSAKWQLVQTKIWTKYKRSLAPFCLIKGAQMPSIRHEQIHALRIGPLFAKTWSVKPISVVWIFHRQAVKNLGQPHRLELQNTQQRSLFQHGPHPHHLFPQRMRKKMKKETK